MTGGRHNPSRTIGGRQARVGKCSGERNVGGYVEVAVKCRNIEYDRMVAR